MLASIVRGAGKVALGTAIGQGLVLAATPWLARLYNPAEFGSLALLLTASNIASAIACARYDLALPSASEPEAPLLMRVACISAVLSGTLVLVGMSLAVMLGAILLAPFNTVWLIPLCVVLVGFQQAAIGAATRECRYADIGAIRVGQGAAFVAFAAFPVFGLLFAHTLSFAISLPTVFKRLTGDSASLKQVVALAKEKKEFPILSLPGALLDVVGYSVCIWIVVYYFGTYDAGQYSQIQRIVGAPLMLAAMSIGQVLFRTSVDVMDNRARMYTLFHQMLLVAALIALSVVTMTALFGESILDWLLGSQWRVDTAFVLPITIAVTVRACVSPLSTMLVSLNRFDLALKWQSIYFLTSVIVFSSAAAALDISSFVLVYAVHEVLLYGLYILIIAKAIRSIPCAVSSA